MVATALAYLAAPIAVSASPSNYTLVNATATFGAAGTDTLTGTFTFDPAGPTLDAVDILVSGPVFPTRVTTPLSATITVLSTTVLSTLASDGFNWVFDFSLPLPQTPDPLTFVDINNVGLGSTSVTGDAVPTPEPSGLALLGGAFGIFLLTRRASGRSNCARGN